MTTTMSDTKPLVLRPVAGPQASVQEIAPAASIRIGRSRACEWCLDHPTVSRLHAMISSRGSMWSLTDLSSRAGTWLNALRLSSEEPALLEHGDLIQIGPWSYQVDLGRFESGPRTITESAVSAGDRVESVSQRDTQFVAREQLSQLLEVSANTHQATSERELAEVVVDAALAATQYHNGAIIRSLNEDQQVEVVVARGRDARPGRDVSFSRSLVMEAHKGGMARLTSDAPIQPGMSIDRLGIGAALCAPIFLSESVVAFLYLDARNEMIPPRAEDEAYCQALSRMYGLALANIKRQDLETRQRRLEADVSAAREAQQLILPPERGEFKPFRYASQTQPGRFVAGDLFDVFPLDGDRLAVCIGDVSGEGAGAAILMAALQAYLHARLVASGDPAEAINAANKYVAARSAANKFVSMWVGVLDPVAGRLSYVDAGHGHWLTIRPGAAPRCPSLPGGTLLGIDGNLVFEPAHYELKPGDRIVLYSDGVIEQPAPSGDRFGNDRLIEVLSSTRDSSHDVRSVHDALGEFATRKTFADDMTIASVEWVGQSAAGSVIAG